MSEALSEKTVLKKKKKIIGKMGGGRCLCVGRYVCSLVLLWKKAELFFFPEVLKSRKVVKTNKNHLR